MKNLLAAIPATLIPGDGIGPEVVGATLRVLDALGSPFAWDIQQAGVAGVNSSGDPLPTATLESIRRTRLALKGPLTTPIGEGFRSANVRLREEIGGFYVAHEYYVPIGNDPRAVAVATGLNSRDACTRIARFAFEYAVKNGRQKITVIHKANILKALTGIFLEAARDVAKEYEHRVQMNDMIIDACAMQLVLNPWQFDMLLCTNL